MPEQQGLDVDDSMLILLGFCQALIGSMLTRHTLLLLAAGAAMATIAAPAHAITQTQTVGPQSFTTTGGTAATGPFAFTGFNTTLGTLTKVNITNAAGAPFSATFGGSIELVCVSATSATCSFTSAALPTFTFTNGSTAAGTLGSLTLASNTVSAPPIAFVPIGGSGTYTSVIGDIATTTPALQSYFAGTPTINNISSNIFTSVSSGPGAVGNSALTLSGDVYLTYTYTNPDPVPGPLPVLGAGAAFGFSRKLRQRIRSSAS